MVRREARCVAGVAVGLGRAALALAGPARTARLVGTEAAFAAAAALESTAGTRRAIACRARAARSWRR